MVADSTMFQKKPTAIYLFLKDYEIPSRNPDNWKTFKKGSPISGSPVKDANNNISASYFPPSKRSSNGMFGHPIPQAITIPAEYLMLAPKGWKPAPAKPISFGSKDFKTFTLINPFTVTYKVPTGGLTKGIVSKTEIIPAGTVFKGYVFKEGLHIDKYIPANTGRSQKVIIPMKYLEQSITATPPSPNEADISGTSLSPTIEYVFTKPYTARIMVGGAVGLLTKTFKAGDKLIGTSGRNGISLELRKANQWDNKAPTNMSSQRMLLVPAEYLKPTNSKHSHDSGIKTAKSGITLKKVAIIAAISFVFYKIFSKK